MRNLLVTGLHGFVGRALARTVAEDAALSAQWTIAPVGPDFQILDRGQTARLVEDASPDAVIHLAAQSAVPESFQDPESTLQINLVGTLRLLQALKAANFRGRMLFVSSGDVYGHVPESELPASELRLPAPRNPYAVSKLAAEALCRQWTMTEGLDIVVARPFNHIGPGQGGQFAVAAFARQIVDIREGRRAPIVDVGDVDVTRDFTDVRDIVRAYFALLQSGASGEVYNVCSGVETTVRSMLEALIELAGVDVVVRRDPGRMRANEQRRAVGDCTRLRGATGWRPRIPIRQTLADILDDMQSEGAQ